MTYEEAYRKLEKYGQLHVLKYYDELDEGQKAELLQQVEETDFSILQYMDHKNAAAEEKNISPIAAMELDEVTRRREEFKKIGLEAVRQGKVAAVLLAGGMGTRLGSDDPKCMYDIGLTHPVYIMERLVSNLMDVVNEAGGIFVPFFIMTSDKNHDKTVSFMKKMNYFGYDPSMVFFFKQEMAPAADYNGKVYMETKSRISTSPNGNGGWFLSMKRAGLIDKVHELGIEWLNTFAVDNVLQRIADPVFVGATIASGSACGAKTVRKAAPDEKVGVMCLQNGRPSIIEYYEMTPELMETKNENGDPAYNFGVIMNYLFREKDLERIVDEVLPVHIVEKKIPCLDENGNPVSPAEPNGYKFEQLVLDMVRELDSCLPVEVERTREFAPIKNKTGIDSVESARELCLKNGIEL
ncbi:UDP-N-acetylglucosamine/UDP-N-acetylgalactosaminediphosphorylase [Sarcina sp. DSM 11001]|uniref:UTP--glucose-1-phosphate uridylyltransferase n=1 Tax=Sarcina sp. DSM 11001 TaxID=1798184 RepID=UPI00088BDD6E|nr:UTP--glucose-1-phosphate uridylyltransferase [Sarcina sp. DSM 11001]SDL16592.1 UDP-N-acetylglucosamine/UDP-N-acetylgalactosaminediphosphorylase [Sarcina sp. DSM 11001]